MVALGDFPGVLLYKVCRKYKERCERFCLCCFWYPSLGGAYHRSPKHWMKQSSVQTRLMSIYRTLLIVSRFTAYIRVCVWKACVQTSSAPAFKLGLLTLWYIVATPPAVTRGDASSSRIVLSDVALIDFRMYSDVVSWSIREYKVRRLIVLAKQLRVLAERFV